VAQLEQFGIANSLGSFAALKSHYVPGKKLTVKIGI
jgi:hypothetical protein